MYIFEAYPYTLSNCFLKELYLSVHPQVLFVKLTTLRPLSSTVFFVFKKLCQFYKLKLYLILVWQSPLLVIWMCVCVCLDF